MRPRSIFQGAARSLPVLCLVATLSASAFAAPRLGEPIDPATGMSDTATGQPVEAFSPSSEGPAPAVSMRTPDAAIAPKAFDEAASGLPLFSTRLLREFYLQRGYRPAWSPRQAKAMLELADSSLEDGLDPADFHAAGLRELISASDLAESGRESSRVWRAELLLSDALLRYLHHLQYGKYNPREINSDWTFVDSIDAETLRNEMHAVLGTADLKSGVAEVLPNAPYYQQLKLAYGRYRALADESSGDVVWYVIPDGANLKIGMRDQRVPAIRERFARLDGYRFPATVDEDIYDKSLYEAVRNFQARSGLAQDGVIGPRTLAALNTPLQDRLAVIRANLERMRWLYHELPSDYLLVDVAAYQLELVRDHQAVWSTRVVVGTGKNQTPMFRDEMEHLVFNPTWSVPSSIQKKMRGVPRGYQVLDRRTGRRVSPSDPTNHRRYRLVQPAGAKNALGRVKFMFPNGHAIYLHDTPSRHLFARSRRSYSHGCVRVENPLDLAEVVLNTPSWDQASIKSVVNRGRTRYVELETHLPVLLYYLTARADEQGRVGFRSDVYDRDRVLFAAMEGPTDTDRLVFKETVEPPVDDPTGRSDLVSQSSLSAGQSTVSDSQIIDADMSSVPAVSDADESPPSLPARPSAARRDQSEPNPWWGLSIPSVENSALREQFPVVGLSEPMPTLRPPSVQASSHNAGEGGDEVVDVAPVFTR